MRRTVTEITAPAALSSVALLRDGFTLIGGGADGEFVHVCIHMDAQCTIYTLSDIKLTH